MNQTTIYRVSLALTVLFIGGFVSTAPLEAGAPLTFSHGVASGDVTSSQAVLWTRFNTIAPLMVEVSTDPSFRRATLRRIIRVSAADDFTAKLVVSGLKPNQTYSYRWRYVGFGRRPLLSDVGTFKTAPLPSAESGTLRFAFAADTDGSKIGGVPLFNHFEALDAARREGLDFFVYLGDTIYPDSRPGGLPAAKTLDEYRARYRENRELSALRQLLQATSTYAIWDDHEVRDDFSGQSVDPSLYAIGRKAFLEYMPLAEPELPRDPDGAGAPLFRVFHWGKDVDLMILDTRSCRSASVKEQCPGLAPGLLDLAPTLPPELRARFGPFFAPMAPSGCLEAITDPSRTMLGHRQKALFKEALLNSGARFKFVISTVPIQQLYSLPFDRWEGYAAERKEILEFIRDRNIKNVIFLTADLHYSAINEVFIDRFTDPAPIADEFMTGPVANLTFEEQTLRRFGPAVGRQALAAQHAILNLVGVESRHLNAYSYGLVEVNAGEGTATITLKDHTGAVLRDQLNPSVACSKTIRIQ